MNIYDIPKSTGSLIVEKEKTRFISIWELKDKEFSKAIFVKPIKK